jgi:hypothetical protein
LTERQNLPPTPTARELIDAGVRVRPGSDPKSRGEDLLQRYLRVPNHAMFLFTSEDTALDGYIRNHWAALDGLTGDACDLHVSLVQLLGGADAYSQFDEVKSLPGLESLQPTDLPALHIWSSIAHVTIPLMRFNDEEKLRKVFRAIFSVVHDARGPIKQIHVKQLRDIATSQNTPDHSAIAPGAYMKLVSLVVLMGLGFGGFYLLPLQKAAMWLGFVIIAIPPILAVVFESSKLSGKNVVELYRLGLRGLPIIGKLVGK